MKNTFYHLLQSITNQRISEVDAVEKIVDEYKAENQNDYAGLTGVLKANLTISLVEYFFLKQQNENLKAKLERCNCQLHEDLIQFQHEAKRNPKESTLLALQSCQSAILEIKNL